MTHCIIRKKLGACKVETYYQKILHSPQSNTRTFVRSFIFSPKFDQSNSEFAVPAAASRLPSNPDQNNQTNSTYDDRLKAPFSYVQFMLCYCKLSPSSSPISLPLSVIFILFHHHALTFYFFPCHHSTLWLLISTHQFYTTFSSPHLAHPIQSDIDIIKPTNNPSHLFVPVLTDKVIVQVFICRSLLVPVHSSTPTTMFFLLNPFLFLLTTIAIPLLVFKFLARTSILYILTSWFRVLVDKCYVYQFYRVPQFNGHMQENQLYRKVHTYLNSLPAVEDSDFTNLFSGNKPNEINLVLDPNQVVVDNFLGARLYWVNEKCPKTGSQSMVLKIRKCDKRRILRPYLQHIHSVFDELEQRKEVQLYINVEDQPQTHGRWRSVPFSHPATIDSVVMESDLKNKVKCDLESFLKSKQYYHRLGRVWKRSYLLYGPSGTGKSTFIAAMAKFLSYDVYDIDLSKVSDDSDLKSLLLQTTSKSLIVMEDLERYLLGKSTAVSLAGILQFMDGLVSCCGEERVMVFTMNVKDHIDPTVLRPGRIDVHLHFQLCDFNAFKSLASSHLGLKDHKLFPQVEEMFQTGASLSPAEIGEIMISNRSSPSRALKSVISALQNNADAKLASKMGRRISDSGSARAVEESGDSGLFCKDGVNTAKEFRKLYGFLRRSRRGGSMDFDEKDNGS